MEALHEGLTQDYPTLQLLGTGYFSAMSSCSHALNLLRPHFFEMSGNLVHILHLGEDGPEDLDKNQWPVCPEAPKSTFHVHLKSRLKEL